MFLLLLNGVLCMLGIVVIGVLVLDNVGNSFIVLMMCGGFGNYVVELLEMVFEEFVVNCVFLILFVVKGMFFDCVYVINFRFDNIFGILFKFDVEGDDFGIYNVEYLIIENSIFLNLCSLVVLIYCGGCDESIFGLYVFIFGFIFVNVGFGDVLFVILYGV